MIEVTRKTPYLSSEPHLESLVVRLEDRLDALKKRHQSRFVFRNFPSVFLFYLYMLAAESQLSVIIATRNRGDSVIRTIDSILQNDFKGNFEGNFKGDFKDDSLADFTFRKAVSSRSEQGTKKTAPRLKLWW